jgi:putative aldouronate transport system permease protein
MRSRAKPIGHQKLSVYLRNYWVLYALLLVPMVYFAVFKYAPMYGVTIAFKDYSIFRGVLKSPWNNFATFKEVFARAEFYRAILNTFALNFLDLIVGFPAPIILAIILSELRSRSFQKVSQTILYLPHFLSWVIIGGMSVQLLSTQTGIVNMALGKIGIKAIPFLTERYTWIATYVLLGVWQSIGWNSIIYLAAISGINVELYEAAAIDGAGRISKIWHITLPGMLPTIVIMLILQLGRMVAIGFDRPFVVGNSLVSVFSDVISTYVYRTGLLANQYSVATAVGFFQSVVGMFFLISSEYIARKAGQQGIWD